MSESFRRTVRCLGPGLLAWILCAAASPSYATLSPQLSLEDLTLAADAVVVATVTSSESVWEGRSLTTHVALDVEQALIGHPPESVLLILPGGVDLNRRIPIATVVAGQPYLRPGDHVLLFLLSLDAGSTQYGLVGDAQGTFFLLEDLQGEPMAVRDLSEARFTTEEGFAHGRTTAVPLDRMVEHVRTLVAESTR